MYGQKAKLLFCNSLNNSIDGRENWYPQNSNRKPKGTMIWRTHRFCVFFLQSEKQEMVSGNPKGNSNLILPLQKQLSGQLCLEAVIVLGLGDLFRCLFCCSHQ